MKRPWYVWLTNELLANILKSEQEEYAKNILPMRQAVIGEETIRLDNEHVAGNDGPKGKDSTRGTI